MPFIQKTVTKSEMAPDLPNAAQVAQQHPDGAVYASEVADPKFKGKRYKLRHAHWVAVVVRKKANGADKKK